jgi:hypothetical protein
MRKISKKELSELAEFLNGTASHSVSEAIALLEFGEVDEDDAAVRLETEGEIFLCTGCGWWCEMDEMGDDSSGDQLCGDCTNE